MNRKGIILQKIWEEKRGKIIGGPRFPFGLNFMVDDLTRFSSRMLVDGMLDILFNKPAIGAEWSKNWGRALVTVNTKTDCNIAFTRHNSAQEKQGVFVSSNHYINSSDFVSDYRNFNKESYEIFLNNQVLKIEGAIIQLERMIDELIWCIYLTLLDLFTNEDSTSLYKISVALVKTKGVKLSPVSEDTILQRKSKNFQDFAIRMYGNIKQNNLISDVVGAVSLGDIYIKTHSFDMSVLENICSDLSFYHFSARKQGLPIFNRIKKRSVKNIPSKLGKVFVAITIGKKMHFGHMIHFAWANLVKDYINPQSRLVIEANDYGERINKTVSRLLFIKGIRDEESLGAELLSPDEIQGAYRTRFVLDSTFQKFHLSKSILKPMFLSLEDVVSDMGLNTNVVASTEVLDVAENISKEISPNNIKGFSFVRIKTLVGKEKMVVLEKGGQYTSPLIRSAVVLNSFRDLKERGEGFSVFIDRDETVRRACDIVNVICGNNFMTQIEGVGMGYEAGILSASFGKVVDARKLIDLIFSKEGRNYVQKKDLLPILYYFLLTRIVTAPSGRANLLGKPNPIGASFVDYADETSFWKDLNLAISEWFSYASKIRLLYHQLKGNKDFVEINKGDLCRETFVSWNKMYHLNLKKPVKETFLRLKPFVNNYSFTSFRKVLHRVGDGDGEEMDFWLIKTLIGGASNKDLILNHLLENEMVTFFDFGKFQDGDISCEFADLLKSRGYSCKQIPQMCSRYLSGDLGFYKKRFIPFDVLSEFVKNIYKEQGYIYVCSDMKECVLFNLKSMCSLLCIWL